MNKRLYKYLSNLNIKEFKALYGIFVFCWSRGKSFISTQSFFNLWCEVNKLCHELDESFPSQYDDRTVIRDFCIAHPYYFIDRLPIDLISRLFAEHCDEQLEALETLLQVLHNNGTIAAINYIVSTFEWDHTTENPSNALKELIKDFL